MGGHKKFPWPKFDPEFRQPRQKISNISYMFIAPAFGSTATGTAAPSFGFGTNTTSAAPTLGFGGATSSAPSFSGKNSRFFFAYLFKIGFHFFECYW